MATYQVNEHFTSFQGEGYWSGVRATFIRLQGCNVGCSWCDTKYTWKKGGVPMQPHEILRLVKTQHVVITGGEPTLYNLDPLLQKLKAAQLYVQLETSGQNDIKGDIWPDWVTVSPKANLDYLVPYSMVMGAAEFKWVVDPMLPYSMLEATWRMILDRRTGLSDCEYAMPYFYLMPEGSPPKPENIKTAMRYLEMANNHKWLLTDRLQYRIGVK